MIILGYYPVADLGEARPQPTLFLDQMETAPALSQGLDDRPPPPPPYLKVWIRHWYLFIKPLTPNILPE